MITMITITMITITMITITMITITMITMILKYEIGALLVLLSLYHFQ